MRAAYIKSGDILNKLRMAKFKIFWCEQVEMYVCLVKRWKLECDHSGDPSGGSLSLDLLTTGQLASPRASGSGKKEGVQYLL